MPDATDRIDYTLVRRYFDAAGSGAAASASYMAHEQNLPRGAVRYRLRREVETIGDWLAAVPPAARVLDLGCGAGTWTALLAERYASVVGVEQSPSMADAAREHLARLRNVTVLQQDVRAQLPEGPFDLVFLGGMCMYLNDGDVVSLLRNVAARLAHRATIISRETTVPRGGSGSYGRYQAVYRSVALYRELFRRAELGEAEARRNYGYNSMEIAITLVDVRRRRLAFLPYDSPALGALTWWTLRASAPITFGLVPRLLDRLNLTWPTLQNHFFKIRR